MPEADLQTFAAEDQQRIRQNRAPVHGCQITTELCQKYIESLGLPADTGRERNKTRLAYQNNLNQFLAWLSYAGISGAIGKDQLLQYRDFLAADHAAIYLAAGGAYSFRTDRAGRIQRRTCSAGTVRQYMRTVSAFCSWLYTEGYYSANIGQGIRTARLPEGHQKDSLLPEDVRRIYRSIPSDNLAGLRMRAMFLVMSCAGLRCIEISRLQLQHYEKRDHNAWLWIQGKGHSSADVKKYLPPEVAAVLDQYLAARPERLQPAAPLFAAYSHRSEGQALDPATISRLVKAALVNAGYVSSRLTAHSLRYAAGNAALEVTGDNLYLAQHYLRHRSPVTTEIYLQDKNGSQDDKRIAEDVYNLYFGNCPENGT